MNSAFQPPSYFFGTIHVPYTRVWDAVSTNTKKAFQAADKVGLKIKVGNVYDVLCIYTDHLDQYIEGLF